jgi:hypothetical protein
MTASTVSTSSGASFASSTSSGGRKRRLPIVSATLPDSVAWLEGLTLDMTAVSSASAQTPPPFRACASIQYQLHASYDSSSSAKTPPTSAWTVKRSFDDYVQFQKRLMHSMHKGHACGAECKWLYGVVKNHFPKASLFCTRCPERVEARRKAMLRVLTTVQASLLNRGNHRCAVFVNEVSKEFADFVMGGSREIQSLLLAPTPSSSERSLTPASSPSLSLAFDSDDSSDEEGTPVASNSPKVCSFCGCGREHDLSIAC